MNTKVIREIDRQAVEAAAREYVARQNLESHPAMELDGRGKYHIADREIRSCCTKFLKRRYELNTHCRSATHVANLFDVDVDAMIEFAITLRTE